MWTIIRQFAALFVICGHLIIKGKFGQFFCEYCYSLFIRTIISFMWRFIRRLQKFINTMLSIPVMEGIVFVYLFKAISFAGHLNEYSQFACLQQLICCFYSRMWTGLNGVLNIDISVLTLITAYLIMIKPYLILIITYSTFIIAYLTLITMHLTIIKFI